MPTFHILTQYIWPDAAPTGLYAEQIATRLHELGYDVRLVGGTGKYRALGRDKPPVPILHLDHFRGQRGNLSQVLFEYASVKHTFARYIENFVREHDVVVVTTAPPNTIQLAHAIKRRGARAIYWLQDYYPELIRGIREYPAALRAAFSAYWDTQLEKWDCVVKIGENLRAPETNSIVIRNWPTLTFESTTPPEPRTALYSGNLGYGHDVGLFVAACGKLREEGYELTVRADGPGAEDLPRWLQVKPLHSDPEKLKSDLLRNEVHLIAGHPKIRRAIFPSKIWNSIALGRRLVCSGFAGEMAAELEAAQTSDFAQHPYRWTQLLVNFAARTEWADVASPDLEPDLAPIALA
jgi:glycosyltransferase involved in cell wall biosynthesis